MRDFTQSQARSGRDTVEIGLKGEDLYQRTRSPQPDELVFAEECTFGESKAKFYEKVKCES